MSATTSFTSRPTAARRSVTILAIDVRHDLALLKAEMPAHRRPLRRAGAAPAGRAGPGRAHLLAGQPAGRGLRGDGGQLQRTGQAQLLPADLLPAARSGGMLSGGPALDQDGQVIGGNVARRSMAAGSASSCPRFSSPRCCHARKTAQLKTPAHRRGGNAAGAPGELTEALHRAGWKPDLPALPRYRCRATASCAAGAAAKSSHRRARHGALRP